MMFLSEILAFPVRCACIAFQIPARSLDRSIAKRIENTRDSIRDSMSVKNVNIRGMVCNDGGPKKTARTVRQMQAVTTITQSENIIPTFDQWVVA